MEDLRGPLANTLCSDSGVEHWPKRKVGRTGRGGRVVGRGGKQFDLQIPAGEEPVVQYTEDGWAEPLNDSADARAENDCGHIEQVDRVRKRHAERLPRDTHCGKGTSVASFEGLDEHLTRLLRIDARSGVDRDLTRVHLKAATSATGALRPVGVHQEVTEFACPAVHSAKHLAIQNNGATHTDIAGNIEEVRDPADSPWRTVGGGNGLEICIIVRSHVQ